MEKIRVGDTVAYRDEVWKVAEVVQTVSHHERLMLLRLDDRAHHGYMNVWAGEVQKVGQE